MITSFQQLLPGFFQGMSQLHNVLMWPAALICYAGLALRLLPGTSMVQFGLALLRLTVVVIVIANINTIGNVLNQIAVAATNSLGFSMQFNALADFETALVTKFQIQTQPGNNNPWQWLFNAGEMAGISVLGVGVYILSMLAACMMLFMRGIQEILFYLEVAMSPILLASLMIPALMPIGTRFATFLASICIWPIGFRVADLVMKAAIDFAVNPSGNNGVATANIMGGALIWWTFIAFWGLFAYPLSAIFVSWSLVTNGSHGLRVLGPALFGGLMTTAAVATGRSPSVPAVAGAANAIAGPTHQPYKNYATRPIYGL